MSSIKKECPLNVQYHLKLLQIYRQLLHLHRLLHHHLIGWNMGCCWSMIGCCCIIVGCCCIIIGCCTCTIICCCNSIGCWVIIIDCCCIIVSCWVSASAICSTTLTTPFLSIFQVSPTLYKKIKLTAHTSVAVHVAFCPATEDNWGAKRGARTHSLHFVRSPE